VTAAMKARSGNEEPYEAEFRVVMRTNEIRWLASSGEFYRDQHGEHRMLGVNLDITLRKQAEETVEAAARGRMAGELAHKINNPLQGLTHALTCCINRSSRPRQNAFPASLNPKPSGFRD